MANGILLKFNARHHALGVLLVLESILVLPIALMPFLILQWEGAEVLSCGHLAYWCRDLYPEAAAQELQPCDSDSHGLKKSP